jgi:hypothetical protein
MCKLKLSLDTYDWLHNVSQANKLFGRGVLDFDDRLKGRSIQLTLASSRTLGIGRKNTRAPSKIQTRGKIVEEHWEVEG